MLRPAENGQLDSITIKGRMLGLNEYINAERTNRYKAAKLKHEAEAIVTQAAIEAYKNGTIHSHTGKCEIWITFVEPNHKRDLDNIAFIEKAIQDALVKLGVFPDDSTKFINVLHYTVAFDANNPRIEITIRENK